MGEINIKLYNPEDGWSCTLDALQLSDIEFELRSNHLWEESLTYGTIIQVVEKQEPDNSYVLKAIRKESDFYTSRFLLNSNTDQSKLRMIGDEIMELGGYWEVVFGGYAIVNIPKDSNFKLDERIKSIMG
ncbi:DUF4265 domain-containing protein [Adhaeribacter radiodurans]|uniref:DUF4265 domain-containing protein n=1 Tax=Adhaeribacter radiodurans TaxID=2745197 RepID=A0A7L7LBS5_9BACT|nr:DUF4265 domain-containing protein [Adhaeribacter radiodurans]QMU30154.1 DUF4265 domain-containing protein [Adhaeribacter radiodurans]